MVIGITIATISYLLLRNGEDKPSVFSPGALRDSLKKEVGDKALRARCLEICDELQAKVGAYDELVIETLEEYLQGVEDYASSADELGQSLEPVAAAREATLLACLDARARLLDLLDAPTWRTIFGEE